MATFIDTPQHAALGDSKGLDDLCLLAGTLNTKLCSDETKGSQIQAHNSATFSHGYVITCQGTKLINNTFGFDLPHPREETRTPQNLMHELLLYNGHSIGGQPHGKGAAGSVDPVL